MMGIFHMAKAALHCAGKYFKGNGIDTALILSKCFGKNNVVWWTLHTIPARYESDKENF